MKQVFILWHRYPDEPDDDNAKLLGVYSSKEIAEERRDRKYRQLRTGEFTIDQYEVDEDHWNEGFFRTDKE
jgi:hypothetical protein